jgi:hypothetical protein
VQSSYKYFEFANAEGTFFEIVNNMEGLYFDLKRVN